MSQEIFERYEKKYMVTERQHELLCRHLKGRMVMDEYGRHTISNIYFDTDDFELIRISNEKPEYKEKLRLRAYGAVHKESTVFLELKKKYAGIVYKRRVSLSLEEAENYLYRGMVPPVNNQIFREIDYAVRLYGLKAAAAVAYDRRAYYGLEDGELRITFDEKIRCRQKELHLNYGPVGTEILPPGYLLMEVKIPGAMPLWLSHLFSELAIYPVSFSKYGTYYQNVLCRNGNMEGGRICA